MALPPVDALSGSENELCAGSGSDEGSDASQPPLGGGKEAEASGPG